MKKPRLWSGFFFVSQLIVPLICILTYVGNEKFLTRDFNKSGLPALPQVY